MRAAAIWGAILIHPILFALAFLKGLLFGHREHIVMSPTSSSGPMGYGLEGAMNAVGELLVLYVMTALIAGVVISVAGAIIGMLICLVVRSFQRS